MKKKFPIIPLQAYIVMERSDFFFSKCPHQAHCDRMGGYILNAINMYLLDTLELLIVWNHNGINMYPLGKRVLVPSEYDSDVSYFEQSDPSSGSEDELPISGDNSGRIQSACTADCTGRPGIGFRSNCCGPASVRKPAFL